jgi:hypothetical protein
MLADAEHLDVLDDDHVVVVLVEDGVVKNFCKWGLVNNLSFKKFG